MAETLLTEEILSLIGTRTEPRQGLVTADQIRKFSAAIDDANPLFIDAGAARAAGFADVVSPPLFNASATRPVPYRSGLLGDGQYDDVAPDGLGHLQTMLAGQSWELVRPTVAGERIIEIFETKSITERVGKTGPILFIEKEATITTVAGELIERYSNTLILREPPPPLPPIASDQLGQTGASVTAATVKTDEGFIKNPDMISLFMFSAAIWAVHRIHWDTPYAQREGLPLPVLPGWMLSSYLAQLAELEAPAGSRLGKIVVRYKSSAHPGDALRCLSGEMAGDGLPAMSIVNQHGIELASAAAEFRHI